MPYTEWPNHPDSKWMHTLQQQQMGLGDVNMNSFATRQKRVSLWAQRDILKRQARAKRAKLKTALSKGFVRDAQEKFMSHIAPSPPIPIRRPLNPIPGISPEAIVAVSDLERKKAALAKKKMINIARVAAQKVTLAKRLQKVPGITQMRLNPRRRVKLPQPTWNYLSTQGIITPGGIITPLGSYVEAGPSEAFGGFGFTPVFRSPASTVLTTSSPGLPAIAQTPDFTGSSFGTQSGSSMAQASALQKECEALHKKVADLNAKAAQLSKHSLLGVTRVMGTSEYQIIAAQLAQAKADMQVKCSQAAQALQDAKSAMASPPPVAPPIISHTPSSPKVEVALPTTTKKTTALPDNTLITTAGGTVVTEAGDEPGIVLHPSGAPSDVIAPAPPPPPPLPLESSPPNYLLLLLAAGLLGGGIYFATKKRG